MPTGKRDPYWSRANALYKCPDCEHLEAPSRNDYTGFDGHPGKLICKRCGGKMDRKELKNE